MTGLSCANNSLTSLDVSNNTVLHLLYCYSNSLTSLDVSNNTVLQALSCGNNSLTSLDVSKNTELTTLYCENNSLTSLDVSKNTKLQYLYCYKNSLTSLNFSGCNLLFELRAENQSISVNKSGNNYLNPISYTPKSGTENIKIGGINYAKGANLPNPANGNTLTFTTNNTASYSINYVFSGTITLEGSVGNEALVEQTFFVYPNPTDGQVTVEGLTPGGIVRIYSVSGGFVNSYKATDNVLKIDISNLAKGMYLFNYEGETLKVIRK